MKALDFYLEAQRDPLIRRKRLEEARFHKELAGGFAIALGAVWLGYVAYCGIVESRWPGDLGVGLSLVLCAALYGQARTRLGALEAIDSRELNKSATANALDLT